MQFDSISFAIFFCVFFFLYWSVSANRLRVQNVLLLVCSYFFYTWWDYRFLFLLIFSTILDFITGQKIHQTQSLYKAKLWLIVSIAVNLGFLGFFKYYNFFIESFASLLASTGLQVNIWTLNVILPVGISFYTFHGLSYVFDIYYKRVTPTTNFVDYSVFVSFFPLLVAGPIERATHLLPQVKRARVFTYENGVNGLRQIVWGLFKKMVIADNCATAANIIFNDYQSYSGVTLALGAVFFALQIYGDFSGYSDIALGTARLLGFDLIRNFAYPYFSRDIAEFWRRWHISLSSWFRDYVYLPLGGSKGGVWLKIRNTFIIFIVSGFWHGANWTFIAWGILNALYYLPLLVSNKNRVHTDIVAQGRIFPSPKELGQMTLTFALTCIAWIFFRSENLGAAFNYTGQMLEGLFTTESYKATWLFIRDRVGFLLPLLIILSIVIEWFGRDEQFAIARLGEKWSKGIRWSFYYSLLIIIILFGGREQQFIYFQF